MKKLNNHPDEFTFLLPLKKRTDLEPDAVFVDSLRRRVAQASVKTDKQPSRLRYILATTMALFTFCILTYTLLETRPQEKNLTQEPEPADTTGAANAAQVGIPESSYNSTELIDTYPYYENLYQSLTKAIQSEEGAKAFILYIHALQQGNSEEAKRYAFTKMDSQIEALIEQYQQINYETFVIDKVIPSKAEPSFEVQLGYQLTGSNVMEKRTIHIHVNDGVAIDIYEPEITQN